MEGNNLTEKVRALFQKIQEYYKAENVESKLPTLTLLMIRKKASQSPKLRAKAAEATAWTEQGQKVFLEQSRVLEETSWKKPVQEIGHLLAATIKLIEYQPRKLITSLYSSGSFKYFQKPYSRRLKSSLFG